MAVFDETFILSAMRIRSRFLYFRPAVLRGIALTALSFFFAVLGAPFATAQDVPSAPMPKEGASVRKDNTVSAHRFWDGTNDWLFAGTGASRTLDYFSTLNMRRRGRQEIFLTNDVVDNHPAFAVIEAAGTGVSIGAAYIFHRYRHHKLERWTSIVHISAATSGAVRNYCLKTAHGVPTP